MSTENPLEQGRQIMIDLCTAIGLDPNNIAVEGFSVDGDTCTFMEFARNDEGSRYLAEDGSGYAKHERTYRLRPAERIS